MTELPSRGEDDDADPTEHLSIEETATAASYWRANVRLLLILLAFWFAVSFGCGILLAPTLNAYTLPGTGFPLGFWFAQQGSIYAFVILIFVYVVLMNRMDRRFGVQED